MRRELEPHELMTNPEQVEAYANANFDAVNTRFADFFVREFGSNWKGKVIVDLGFGTGQVSLTLASRIKGARIVGLEGSSAMIERWARVEQARAGTLESQVDVCHEVIPCVMRSAKLPKVADAVISNAFAHHIADPMFFWSTVHAFSERRMTRILVIDLLRPNSLKDAEAIVQRAAGSEHPILKRDFLASLKAAFTVEEVQEQIAEFHGLEVSQIDDHHWAAYGTLSDSLENVVTSPWDA